MASASNSPVSSDNASPLSKNTRSKSKSILKSSTEFQEVCRYDRDGTAITAKNHRITFIDRVIKGTPIQIIYEVEQIVYPDPPSDKNSWKCRCILF